MPQRKVICRIRTTPYDADRQKVHVSGILTTVLLFILYYKKDMDWKEFFKKDLFASDAGIAIEQVEPGYAVTSMKIEARHLNAGGVAQGGAIFTLADLAMAAAANAHGILSFSIQSDIRFLESAMEGDTIRAEARERLLKRNIAHYSATITGDGGKVIAIVDGILYRKQASPTQPGK